MPIMVRPVQEKLNEPWYISENTTTPGNLALGYPSITGLNMNIPVHSQCLLLLLTVGYFTNSCHHRPWWARLHGIL
jgi:hypothetical protein